MSMIVLAAVLLSSQAASPPARSATDLTRDLNSAPPAAVPTPRPPVEEPPARPAPTTTAPAAQTTPPARTQPAPAPQAGTGSSLTRDLNSGPAATPPVTPTRPAATRTPTPAPAPSPAAAQPAAAAQSPSTPPASTPAAPADPLAALPFRIDLPEGFTIEPSEAGPQAKVYAVKRDGRSFVMIYQGPASQFPIYDGQLIDAGGRASVVIEEDGRRRAVEHLFAKDLESRETHVWLSYLEGPDSAQAEQIAQSVEPR
jgi:hypothetical protein